MSGEDTCHGIRKIHLGNPELRGKQIHEIHPVKFGGSPTDSQNKIYLTPQEHRLYNSYWLAPWSVAHRTHF